nr:alpha/beta hydrolase domain-containing protein [Ramlibacter cellulosilyticus]
MVGKAYGEIDPNDPRNQVITDLVLAPRNARGRIEYSMDIYILKPTDLAKGNHKLFVEVNNRGGKLFGAFNQSSGGNDPSTAAHAGGAFLMKQGYTMAWNGWDPSAPSGGGSMTINVPVAKNPDGSSITGPSYEYIVFDNATTQSATLSYKAATLDKTKATLTVRDHLADTPVTVPSTGWEYASDMSIRLLPAGTAFKQSAIYEFTYTAIDPVVAGIGFAATRDFISWLRHNTVDAQGTANPVAGDVKRVLGYTVSQPGRYMNDFVWLGFNEDIRGRKVFDGVENWIAAGNGIFLNYRFAQPGRTERNRQNHLYPEAPFPFAYNTLTDTLTGRTDGRNRRCQQTNTCPKIMSVNSANEYWVKAGSLVHTDTAGNDIADPENVRFYLLSGLEHTVTGSPTNSAGTCAQFRNNTDPNPALRALFVAMDQWIDGTAPPASRMPRRSDGTAVFTTTTAQSALGIGVVPQASLGWPNIPGVQYTGLVTVRNLFDFGSRFASGILDKQPPTATGKVYPSFVSKVDVDGNEIAGVRLPPVAAPIATTTGWGLRATAFGGPDGCEASGQMISFATTLSQRVASGDPRLSLEERYVNKAGYVAAVTAAANALKAQRLLLDADAQAYITSAQNSTVLP